MKMLLLWLVSFSASAAVSISVEPQVVSLGQDTQLILKNTDVGTELPDLTGLVKDFAIVGTQQSNSYQNINGKSSHETLFIVLLSPKHAGQITIPGVRWGKDVTNAVTLDVQDIQTTKVADHDKTVFLTWSLEPKHPLVHEQIKLVLKVYHAGPLLDAKINPPAVNNGLLFALDNKVNLLEIQNNKRYQVEQYSYIIYPQQSGDMLIKGPAIEALEYDTIPKQVHDKLADKTLHISPALQKDWLPVKSLSYQELLPLGKHIGVPVNDTISRKLVIKAVGIPAQLIPDLYPSCGANCRVYINPAKIDNKMVDGELHSQKVFEITYLPERIGSGVIQPIKLAWFNTQTRKAQQLLIPGVPFEVLQAKTKVLPRNNQEGPRPWLNSLLGLLAGMLIVFFGKKIPWLKAFDALKGVEIRNYKLKKACCNANGPMTRVALLKWAKRQGFKEPIADLHDIARQINDKNFAAQLEGLLFYLYGNAPHKKWHGAQLWSCFNKLKITKQVIAEDSDTLNP